MNAERLAEIKARHSAVHHSPLSIERVDTSKDVTPNADIVFADPDALAFFMGSLRDVPELLDEIKRLRDALGEVRDLMRHARLGSATPGTATHGTHLEEVAHPPPP